MSLTIGSLFSGIGGLELGIERGIGNGAHTIWQVEQSEYCRAVLAKHWPDATRYDDVRTVGRATLASVDVICGGFPCQDVSLAGSRAGIAEGTRSGLWYEYARIVGELRPRYVVVENVAALLTSGFDIVLGELASLGYDAWWDCLPAASVGAPHRRDRLFLLAYPALVQRDGGADHGRRGGGRITTVSQSGNGRGPTHLADAKREQGGERRGADVLGGRTRKAEQARMGGRDVAHPERRRLQGGVQQHRGAATVVAPAVCRDCGGDHEWWTWDAEPAVGRLAHGLPARLVEHSLRALGNAVVPQVAEVVGRLIAEREALDLAA